MRQANRISPKNYKSNTILDGYHTEMGTSTETPGLGNKHMRNDDRFGLNHLGYNTHDEGMPGRFA